MPPSIISRLYSSRSNILSSEIKCSSPLITFFAFHCTVSSVSMSFSYWGTQTWTQSSRCGLTSAEQSRRVTSQPAGNAVSPAAQDTIGLFCCRGTLLTQIQLGICQDYQLLSCQDVFQQGGPQHTLALETWGLFLPRWGVWCLST